VRASDGLAAGAGRQAALLASIEASPQATLVLGAALQPGGHPSHAYLLHGPSGTGKAAAARAFAAALLADGASDAAGVAERVGRDAHPDLTWVRPSGSGEMLVSDIEQAVVAAAALTPFESRRRVFVLEDVERMNDQAAARMLKTLEEPPRFAHLILLTSRREDVLATIASRCLHVRFDAPPPARIAERVAGIEGVTEEQALACARLAEGDVGLAEVLAGQDGVLLRAGAQELARCAMAGRTEGRPWLGLLEQARAAGARRAARAEQELAGELELVPAKERRRYEKESVEARRRAERRVRTRTLDLGLRLTELWLRDVMCVCEGAGELVLAVDRRAELEADAQGRDSGAVRRAMELVGDTRLSLRVNVSEELALEGLAYSLQALLAGG
jgi:DNA polymerase-3 subunit delta'